MDCNERDSTLRGRLKSMIGAAKYLRNTGQPSLGSVTYERLTGPKSRRWTSSVEVFLASHSLWLENEKGKRTTAISGQKSFDVWKSSSPLGSLARMCLGSSTWRSTKCALIWRVSATKSGQCVFRLVPLMPRTSDSGSGLWPTASAQMAGENEAFLISLQTKDGEQWKLGECAYNPVTGQHVQKTLNRAVKMWPTPHGMSQDWKSHGPSGNKLGNAVNRAMWSTPKAQNAQSACPPGQGGTGWQEAVGGSLNPDWVEWLMGFPIGWTALED